MVTIAHFPAYHDQIHPGEQFCDFSVPLGSLILRERSGVKDFLSSQNSHFLTMPKQKRQTLQGSFPHSLCLK